MQPVEISCNVTTAPSVSVHGTGHLSRDVRPVVGGQSKRTDVRTHLHDGFLEVVEVDRLESLETDVSPSEIVQQRRQRLVVVVQVVDDGAHRLHEPLRMTPKPRVVE